MSSTSEEPLAFFWDLENCQVPNNKSAISVVKSLRDKFGDRGAEEEFVVVCDVNKEKPEIVNDLNLVQVNVIHVSSLSKNAADEKLRSCLRKFAHQHKAPATVILISGDVNFAPDLYDLRYRCSYTIILVHGSQVTEALLSTAHFHLSYREIVRDLPEKLDKPRKMNTKQTCQLEVRRLPFFVEVNKIRERLKQISDNCGGRVVTINRVSRVALVRFPNPDATLRAKKRMENEDVFGAKISVNLCRRRNTLIYKSKFNNDRKVGENNSNEFRPIKNSSLAVDFPESDTESSDAETDMTTEKDRMNGRNTHEQRALMTEKLKRLMSFKPAQYVYSSNSASRDTSPTEIAQRRFDQQQYKSNTIPDPNELSEMVVAVLVAEPSLSLPLQRLPQAFHGYHGIQLAKQRYKFTSLRQLAEKLTSVVKLENKKDGVSYLTLSEHRLRAVRAQQLYYLFLRKPEFEFSVEYFRHAFRNAFKSDCDVDALKSNFPEILQWTQRPDGAVVLRLTPVQQFSLRARNLLLNYGCADVPLFEFEMAFERRYRQCIRSEEYGFLSLIGLIRAASHVLYIKGRGYNSTVCINRNFLALLKPIKQDVIIPTRSWLNEMRSTNRQRYHSDGEGETQARFERKNQHRTTYSSGYRRTFTNRQHFKSPRRKFCKIRMGKSLGASPLTDIEHLTEEQKSHEFEKLSFSLNRCHLDAGPMDTSFMVFGSGKDAGFVSHESTLVDEWQPPNLCPPEMFTLLPPDYFMAESPAKDSGVGSAGDLLSRSSDGVPVDLDGESFFGQMAPIVNEKPRKIPPRRSRLAIKFPAKTEL